MKKFLAIFALCFAVFAAKAQVTIILEAHDVWEDGSGYQLLLDADATAFGTIIPATGPLTSSGDADDATYAEFEYKVPANADGVLTTQNMVMDGDVTITIPAGTYDFCVTNPTPNDRVWIAGGDNARQDDYVFQDGYTYHFTVAREGSGDAVTIEVSCEAAPNAPADFTAVPDPNYGLSVELSWNNPTTTFGGTALTAINSIELYRGTTLVNSFANPTPGASMSFTDNSIPAEGMYAYRVYAVTEVNGYEASATAYVGHVCPITIAMEDSYGDGWNGAAIEVYTSDNTLVGTYTIESGSSAEEDIPLVVGTYTFNWVSGSYDSECSFTITNAFDIPLYTGSSMSAGTFLTLNHDCEPPVFYTVSGTVTDASNTPIAGAVLTCSGYNVRTATTNAAGTYSMDSVLSILPYSMTVEAAGFNGTSTSFNSLSADTTINFILTAPQFAVTYEAPIEVTTSYGLDAQFSPITVTNSGNGTLTWGTGVEFVRGDRNVNEPMRYSVAQMPRVKEGAVQNCRMEGATATAQTMQSSVEYSPMVTTISGNTTRAAWDLLSSFDAENAGEQGIATDGNYIYTCFWNAAGQFGKYDLDGNFIESFTIAGVGGIRDLTYDGTYFYGGAGSSDLYQIDMASQSLVSTISTQVSAIRHCSYDPQSNGFWVGNWSDLYLVDRNGNIVVTGPEVANVYGSAYDGYSAGGPFLWLFTQASGNTGASVFAQYDIAANALTNVTVDLSSADPDLTSDAMAGGAFGTDALVGGKFVIMANSQQQPNHVSIVEVADAGWLSAAPGSGTVAPGQSTDITLNFNGSYPVGDYNANLTITSRNPFVGDTVIPVIFHIVAPACDAPTNLQVVPTDYEYMALTWDAPADVTNLVEYRIYKNNGANYITCTTTSYDDHVNAGTYCYTVKAYFENDGEPCLSYSTDTVCEEMLLCHPDSMCDIRVDMYDDYGDGWNGAAIRLMFNNQMVSSFTCEGSQSSLTVPVCSGQLSFVWVAGSYDSECMFTIYNANNVVLYDGQAAPSAGEFFTYNLDCQNLENAINEMEAGKSVSIYPNPATSVLNVVAEGYNTIEVINLLGQTVYTCNATNSTQINVNNLKNGVYFVRVNGENGTTTQKFIKK